MTATAVPLPDTATDATALRLLRSTAKQSYDPEVDIDWDAPLVDGAWFMQPERLSLYGTPIWQAMTQEQRVEMSRHEVASIASVGHSLMFGRAIARCGVPAYGPTPHIHRLGRAFKAVAGGVSAYASILVAEEILDRWQRELMKDDRVQPLIRMVSRIHVLEEARHMTFAREEVERAIPRMGKAQLAFHRTMVAQTAFMVSRTLVNPQVYAGVGLDPRAAKKAAFTNPHYRDTMAWMGERVVGFLEEQDLIGPTQRRIWQRSLLMPA